MQEVFDCLSGAQYFTTVDMKSGYHQIEVEKDYRVDSVYPRTIWIVGIQQNTIWTNQFPGYLSEVDDRVFRRPQHMCCLY